MVGPAHFGSASVGLNVAPGFSLASSRLAAIPLLVPLSAAFSRMALKDLLIFIRESPIFRGSELQLH